MAEPVVIWTGYVDSRYTARVHKVDDHNLVLVVSDEAGVIYDEDLPITYDPVEGPTVYDVSLWAHISTQAVDHHEGRRMYPPY